MMKFPSILLLAVLLFTAGCAIVPSPYSEQLKPIAKRYGSVESGVPLREVEALLGNPSRKEKDGSFVWETRIDKLNYAMVKVWFDAEDKAQKIEFTQAHGTSR